MANFLLTYHGEGGMPSTDEERAQVMGAWTTWFTRLGDAVVDGGNPTSQAKAISPDGSVLDATSAPTGYSIIRADSLDAAVALSTTRSSRARSVTGPCCIRSMRREPVAPMPGVVPFGTACAAGGPTRTLLQLEIAGRRGREAQEVTDLR